MVTNQTLLNNSVYELINRLCYIIHKHFLSSILDEFMIPITYPHLLLFCNTLRIVEPLNAKLVGWKQMCADAPVIIQTLTIPKSGKLVFKTISFNTNEVNTKTYE